MAISKRFFIRKTSVLTALFIAYAISSVINPEGMGNVLSPLSAFAAGGILLFSYLRSDRSVKISLTLLLYALACLVWGIADVIWAAMSFSGKDPENSALLWIVYVLTNGFLMASIILFAVEQFQKWDLVQFVIDLIISGFLTGALFWVLFLKKDLSVLRALLASDLTSLASILADIVICISIFSWFLSIRAGRIPGFIRVLSAGLLLFSFADLYYYYIAYNGLYLANSLVDVAYIASMNLLAFGALWKTYKDGSVFDLSVTLNTGSRMRWIYLILYPFFAVLFSVTGIVDIQMTLTDFVTFALPIFLYWGSCKYVQLSLEKEALLRNQNKLLEQRVAEQIRELEFLANQDTLTTLFNRRYFMSCLSDTIETLRSTDLMAVLLMDLDRFKTINDMYGHDVGDRVLIELSHRLIAWNNCGATIARLGGDEFSILLAGKYTQKDIEDFCVELIDLCSKPIGVGDLSLPMTMSVGIALASSEEIDGKTLMTQADLSMYSAKAQGYNKYQIFNPLIHQDFKNNVEIEALLRQADCEKDFTLYYQPQYSLPDLKLVGAEALLRWETETLGFIPPGVFIPIAEETEHIFNIGKWVIKETVNQTKRWNDRHSLQLKLGFNLSPKQFDDLDLIHFLKEIISSGNLNPAWLDAEITESVMIGAGKGVEETFALLKKIGITVSVDDFGSGYSSLGYLNQYSFDRIKLDKSLIDSVSKHQTNSIHVLRAVIDMAHASGILTIAEGVETEEQLDLLIKLGCDQVQGYLLGRPVPASVFEQRFIGKPYAESRTPVI